MKGAQAGVHIVVIHTSDIELALSGQFFKNPRINRKENIQAEIKYIFWLWPKR
jgi:hypothetical protein